MGHADLYMARLCHGQVGQAAQRVVLHMYKA